MSTHSSRQASATSFSPQKQSSPLQLSPMISIRVIMNFHRSTLRRPIATGVIAALLGQMLAPLSALALTGGPTQPEFSSFEPVTTTNMVNEFTGGFTYNLPVLKVPGPEGAGYALSLSYHSGASAE